MRWKNRLFFLSFLFTILFSQLGSAQNYFFHLLGVAGGQTFTWTGVAGDNDWNNPLNWSTNSVPGVGDVANFKGAACTGANCNANITSNISVLGVDIDVGYAGTITQNAGFTIIIGTSGWKQAGGTFTGGNSNVTFNASTLTLSGSSTYTATMAQTYFNETQAANVDVISTTAAVTLTFPNSSLQKFYLSGGCGYPLYSLNTANKISFYNLTVSTAGTGCSYAQFGHPSLAVEIRGDFSNATLISTDAISFRGSYELYGNMTLNSGDVTRDSKWRWMGATNSTYSTTGSFGVGAIQIEKSGGATVTPLAGTTQLEVGGLYVKTGSFTFPTALSIYKTTVATETFKVDTGTTVVVPANSTLSFYIQGACGGPVYNIDVDSNFDFQNVVITGGGTGCGRGNLTVVAGDTVTVKKNLTLGSDHDTNGAWILEGNLVKGTMAVFGGIALTLQGTAAQALDTVAWGTGPITVNKASGTASLSANFTVSSTAPAMTVQSGVLNLNAKNLSVTNTLTVGAAGKILCNGGTLTAGSYAITGEISCGTGVGITWTGLAGDNLWSTAGNWTNNNIPGSSDSAIFNSFCTGANCNAQINSNLSVKGIWLTSSYPGTLTQNSTRTLTMGTVGFVQDGGAFAGGDSAITMNGPFTLSGGTFTSTTNTMALKHNVTMSLPAATFNHNSGTVTIESISSGSDRSWQVNNVVFWNFSSTGSGYSNVKTITGTITVNGAFSCINSGTIATLNGGTINAKGSISFADKGCYGSTNVTVAGTGNQTVTGASGAGVPNFTINSTGGTVSLVGSLDFMNAFTYTQGTVAPGTSTAVFYFMGGGSNYGITLTSPLTFNNVYFGSAGYNSTRTITGTMNVAGTFTCAATGSTPGTINSGTINALGDLVFAATGCQGTVLIKVAGSSNQTMTGAATGFIPNLEISSTGGSVSLVGTLMLRQNFTYTQGTVNAGTSTVAFYTYDYTNFSISLAAPLSLYNVNITGSAYVVTRTISGSDLTVNGTFWVDVDGTTPATVNGSKIIAKGDVSFPSGPGMAGTTAIEVAGSGNQTISGVSTAGVANFEINSTGGTVSLSGTINFISNFTYTQGTVAPGTSTVNFHMPASSTKTVSLANPLTLYNVAFVGSGSSSVRNFSGSTLTVTGTLTCQTTSSSVPTVNGATFMVEGDVYFSSYGCAGTSSLTMSGSANKNLTLNPTTSGRTFSQTIVIDKSAAATVTMTVNANLATGQSMTVANGVLNLGGYSLSVPGTLTVAATGTLKCSGGYFTAGTFSNSGTVSCPGYATYPFQWTGAGGNSNWSTPGNWQGGVVPGASDIPSFTDTYCTLNCNVTIDTAVSIKGLEIIAPYSGTITQGSGNTIAIGARGWIQPAGTFVGSNANITITGPIAKFSLTGTSSFTAPSATLELSGYQTGTNDTIFTVGSSATFSHNSGTVKFSIWPLWSTHPSYVIDVPNLFQLNHVIISQSASLNMNEGGIGPVTGRTIVVNGNLTHGTSAYANTSGVSRLDGSWQLKGNFTIGTDAVGGSGSITLNGTGNQVVTGDANGYSGDLVINKASGNVTTASSILRIRGFYLDQGNFTAPTGTLESFNFSQNGNGTVFRISSGTTMNLNGCTVNIAHGTGWSQNPVFTIDVPDLYQFNSLILHQNVAKNNNSIAYAPVTGRTIVVNGNLTHGTSQYTTASGMSKINGAWQVKGNLSIGTDAVGGTGTITLNGTGAQSITQAAGGVTAGGLFTVNKTAGTAALTSNLALSTASQDLTITAGTLNMAGFNLSVARNISNSGVLRRGTSPSCGTVTSTGYSGTAAICP